MLTLDHFLKEKKKNPKRPSPSHLSHTKRMFHITQARNANRRKTATKSASVCSICEKTKGK